MTYKEKLKQIHPELVDDCYGGGCHGCPSDYGWPNQPYCLGQCNSNEKCAECWNREIPGTEQHLADTTEAVNHPKHYTREGAMECIDEMVMVFGAEAAAKFCLLNAWKYRYRAGDKGGDEDLRKSDWYLAKYKELKGDD